jgi:hypothetical protein
MLDITGDRTAIRVVLTPSGANVDVELRIPPGTTTLRLSTSAPTAAPNELRDLRVQLRSPTVADAAVEAALGSI